MTGLIPRFHCSGCDKRRCCEQPHQVCGDCKREEAPEPPYERAVRRVESMTGRLRSTWEGKPNHPLTLAANSLARKFAKISELPNPNALRGACQPRRKKTA